MIKRASIDGLEAENVPVSEQEVVLRETLAVDTSEATETGQSTEASALALNETRCRNIVSIARVVRALIQERVPGFNDRQALMAIAKSVLDDLKPEYPGYEAPPNIVVRLIEKSLDEYTFSLTALEVA